MTLPAQRPGRQLSRWDPFREFEDLYTQMGRLWDRTFNTDTPTAGNWSPLADVCETGDSYVVEIDVPGVKREDISVQLTGNDLVVSGELKETEREGMFRRRTRRTGSFEYRTNLPADVRTDDIDAHLHDGVLTLRIPKAEAAQPRKIEIKD
ncbi:Hsp20/alpha crystallin family protein [Lentzea sp. PSKA42]|uniref:Hsp20/alpha crystallin family protein n=1 Tax=Lentzea indica TaxID=2604800 RepID=A0ABX1FIC3_9PSEU|nr:Hsp20/alpha crystallin family protein [Lentzea indica]NKE58381.1 Hsp20/alpha crystallin family protein [Lentzea indica]